MVREIWKGCWLIRLSSSKDKGQDNANDRTLSDLTQNHSVFVGILGSSISMVPQRTFNTVEPFHCTMFNVLFQNILYTKKKKKTEKSFAEPKMALNTCVFDSLTTLTHLKWLAVAFKTLPLPAASFQLKHSALTDDHWSLPLPLIFLCLYWWTLPWPLVLLWILQAANYDQAIHLSEKHFAIN